MRVATAHSYDTTVANLNKRQSDLAQLQAQLSAGKRVQRASDDPAAAVQAEAAQNRLARAVADQRAVEASRTSLAQAESALGSAGETIQQVRELFLKAGNATYGSADYKSIAQEIEGLRDQLLAVANQTDSMGRTLFGGQGGSSVPFVEVYGPGGNGVRFDGQSGQVAAGDLTLPQSLDGQSVWMSVPPGNGTFTVALGSGNAGSVTTDIGRVADPAAVTGHGYSISFANAGGTLQYTVTDTTTGLPVPAHNGVAYQPGTIEFDGLAVELKGQPKAGDSVAVDPVSGSTDLFRVMQDAIDALNGASTGQTPQLTQALGRALTELDTGYDRVLAARSQAGQWLNRADSLDNRLADRQVEYEAEQSSLVDMDMIKGISDFQNQQVGLQAALQSYAQVQRLSLFQYLG